MSKMMECAKLRTTMMEFFDGMCEVKKLNDGMMEFAHLAKWWIDGMMEFGIDGMMDFGNDGMVEFEK